ncbi:MAG: hypothetical protein Kow00128_00430 [Deltaproteobacteria bacterium]
MKKGRVVAWIPDDGSQVVVSLLEAGIAPFGGTVLRCPDTDEIVHRVAENPADVLLIGDRFPFDRTFHLLSATEEMANRPVIIACASDMDVRKSVELMERGVFTIVEGTDDPREVAGAIARAIENRRAFQKVLKMSRSLDRSLSSLQRKRIELSAERRKRRQKASEVHLMRRVAELLGRARTLEEGFAEVLPHLLSVSGASGGAIAVAPERGKWLVSTEGAPGIPRDRFPEQVSRFHRSTPFQFSRGTIRFPAKGSRNGFRPEGIAFPVRVKRRFLGYGLLWREEVPAVSVETMKLLEAVGVQIGAFCENTVLQEQVETERDRLASVNEELNFLFRLAASLHEEMEVDALFEWLWGGIRRFVECIGLDILCLVDPPAVRTFRVHGSHGMPPPSWPSDSEGWSNYLMARHGLSVPAVSLNLREVSYPPSSRPAVRPRGGGHVLREIPLLFGERTMGLLVVHFDGEKAVDARQERLLGSIGAQLSLYLHNLAERKRIQAMASRDYLTGLLNFRSFQEIFDREFERHRRYSRNLTLVMIDLDNFKSINDTFGHPVGDKVLTSVGRILGTSKRKTDYAFRYGGDEFLILMPDRSASQAEIFARRLLQTVHQEIRGVSPFEFSVSMSIGIADCSQICSREKEELLKRADGALYMAKSRGKNRIHVADPPRAGRTGPGESYAVQA